MWTTVVNLMLRTVQFLPKRVLFFSAMPTHFAWKLSEANSSNRLAEGSSNHISWSVCTAQCGFFICIDVGHEAPPCRALRAPAGRGSGGASRLRPFSRPTRYPPSPTLPPAPRLPAARAQARALAHRISVCALSSEAPITPGIHGRRGVLPETRIEAPASWRTIDSARPSPSPASTRKTASAIPAHRFAHSADPSGRRVPPWGATRAAPILARPSTPASAPSSTYGNYPRRGLEPAARNPHPQQDCLQPTCSPTTFDCVGRD